MERQLDYIAFRNWQEDFFKRSGCYPTHMDCVLYGLEVGSSELQRYIRVTEFLLKNYARDEIKIQAKGMLKGSIYEQRIEA
jgi:hypothetical protein